MSAADDADAAASALTDAIAGPKRVRGDAGEVEQHSLADLIAAEKHQRAKAAAGNPRRGLRFTQLKPPGSA